MRLYNGCPDSELKAIWDDRDAAKKEARELGILLTWFPMEAKWAACRSGESDKPYESLGGFHSHIRDALNEAKELM